MRTKVVGVTFTNEDGSSRAEIIAGMSMSDQICLERDPYNQYDSNAVKVNVVKNGVSMQIGFLAKDIAMELSPKLRRRTEYKVTIVGCGMWNGRPFCELEIEEMGNQKTESLSTTSQVSYMRIRQDDSIKSSNFSSTEVSQNIPIEDRSKKTSNWKERLSTVGGCLYGIVAVVIILTMAFCFTMAIGDLFYSKYHDLFIHLLILLISLLVLFIMSKFPIHE